MARSVSARFSEHFQWARDFFLELAEFGKELTEEQSRNIATFEALDNSLADVPHELIERVIQLRARNAEAFENSVSAMIGAVCDTFRPATAAEFIEKVNEDIRSELELGKSKGRERGAFLREVEAMTVAGGNDF
jgi:hypothetical protein